MRISILLLIVCLFGGCTGGAGDKDKSDVRYFALFIGGVRFGYMEQEVSTNSNYVMTSDVFHYNMPKSGKENSRSEVRVVSLEGLDGTAYRFDTKTAFSGQVKEIQGQISGDIVELVSKIEDQESTAMKLPWPEDTIIGFRHGFRKIVSTGPTEAGSKYTIRVYHPIQNNLYQFEITVNRVRGVELVEGRQNLLELDVKRIKDNEAFDYAKYYFNDKFQTVKVVWKKAGGNLEIEECSKSFALTF